VFVSKILLLLALGLAKTSVVLFIRQLFTQSNAKVWRFCTIGATVTAAWAFVACLAVSIGCSPESAVQDDGQCRGDVRQEAGLHRISMLIRLQIFRWISVVVLDTLFEIAILASAAKMFAELQMNRHKKTVVMLAFAFRIM